MAPSSFPDEIDVFSVPHSRMKELVDIYTQKVQCLDYRNGREVISLLHDLVITLYEFKSHESIENIFIMDQLKTRLKQRQIHNTAVCDCHNDNRLADVLQLVRTGTKVREQGMVERLSFGQELQRAFEEFVKNFLTHMEEEEQVFQPLLVEYFEYDELKVLKDIVLKEHEHVKERQNIEKAHKEEPETCDIVKDLRDLDWDLGFLGEAPENDYCSSVNPLDSIEEASASWYEETEAPHLPAEILLEIYKRLSPQDIGRCAQVCSSWNNAAYSPALWKAIYPVQWARGIWEWYDVGLCKALEDAALHKMSDSFYKWDEDKDVDEAEEEINPIADREYAMLEGLVSWVLPRIGEGVGTLVVDAGLGISPRLLHHALILCPNITILSAAHTKIDYYLFKGLWRKGSLQKLQRLDLQGCELIDDDAMECLAQCAVPYDPCFSRDFSNIFNDDVRHLPCASGGQGLSNEFWTGCNEGPIYQYCGVCTCWRSNNPYFNLLEQSEYSHTPFRKQTPVKPANYRKQNSGHVLSHSRQESNGRGNVSAYEQSPSSYELVDAERDIEEICCRPGSSHSSVDNEKMNVSCSRNLAVRGNGNDYSDYEGEPEDGIHLSVPCNVVNGVHFQLEYLNLSGCWKITDEGILALVEAGAVDRLHHLDVSGCFQLSGEGLSLLVRDSRALKAENLYYCDNIVGGPFPDRANGCANLCNPIRTCCRNGR